MQVNLPSDRLTTDDRPVRESEQQAASNLLRLGSGSRNIHANAMMMSWERISAYAFPPDSSDPKSPSQIVANSDMPRDPRSFILAQADMVSETSLHVDIGLPLILPTREDLIMTADGLYLPETTIQTTRLTAWPISSDPTRQQDFRAQLLRRV